MVLYIVLFSGPYIGSYSINEIECDQMQLEKGF